MKILVLLAVSLFTAASICGQHGGKAEPKRIEFARGRSSITLTGELSNGQEMEYVFAAAKGQTVTIRMANTSLFDYRVFNAEAEFETEFDSSRASTLELPANGDYLLYVRKKMVSRPRTARYSLNISIR
jgi:hypothetical protein